MKALSPRVPFDYVCVAERALPKEQQTTFKLCGLSFAERAYLDDQRWDISGDGTGTHKHGTARRIKLKCGLHGWENLDGAMFEAAEEFLAGTKRARPTDASIERLDVETQAELCHAIDMASRLSDTDRKNS